MGVLATDDDMPWILGALDCADDIAIDTETTGLNVRNNIDYMMGLPLDIPELNVYIPFRHQTDNVSLRWKDPLWSILRRKPLIWHNLKFDYHSLRTFGWDPLELVGPQFCTQILFWMWNSELPSKELEWLAKVFLKEEKVEADDHFYEYGKTFGFNTIPPSIAAKRTKDATLTRQLREFIWPKLVSQELTSVYWDTELPFARLLYKIEQRGLGVDSVFCENKSRIGRGRMATIQRELGFNPASSLDLGSYLLGELDLPVIEHTDSCPECKNGAPVGSHEWKASFNKRVMEEYDDILQAVDNPNAKRIVEYRGWQKAVTSLYEPMLEKVGPDGHIRTQFKQHGTVTRRLSSSDPNLQQIPRQTDKVWNGDAKRGFTSGKFGEEYGIFGWDYSQLEFRLAASYGQEADILAEFDKPDADPFSLLAPRIFGILTPETRHKTKNGLVYPKLYGAGKGKVALSLGVTYSEMLPIYEQFTETIPGIISISEQVQHLMEDRGFIRYWDGSRRTMKDRRKSYAAFNSLCQGGASQLVKKAMLECEKFETDEFFMVLQVHDEITFNGRRDKVKEYEPEIVKAMTNFDMGVNLHVEGKEWK